MLQQINSSQADSLDLANFDNAAKEAEILRLKGALERSAHLISTETAFITSVPSRAKQRKSEIRELTEVIRGLVAKLFVLQPEEPLKEIDDFCSRRLEERPPKKRCPARPKVKEVEALKERNGLTVCKVFDYRKSRALFHGTVHYEPNSRCAFEHGGACVYKVLYEDGDREYLTAEEVDKILLDNAPDYSGIPLYRDIKRTSSALRQTSHQDNLQHDDPSSSAIVVQLIKPTASREGRQFKPSEKALSHQY